MERLEPREIEMTLRTGQGRAVFSAGVEEEGFYALLFLSHLVLLFPVEYSGRMSHMPKLSS